jgi:hypothetical protein
LIEKKIPEAILPLTEKLKSRLVEEESRLGAQEAGD